MKWHKTTCEVYYSVDGEHSALETGYSNGKYFLYKQTGQWYIYNLDTNRRAGVARSLSAAKITVEDWCYEDVRLCVDCVNQSNLRCLIYNYKFKPNHNGATTCHRYEPVTAD